VEHLRAAAKVGPVVLLCNHLAYVDANAIDALLAWSGERALADRLVVLAGPKVFEHPFRRVAATCIHTVPTPQSTSLAHTEKMSRKELVRRANRAMAAAGGALDQGLLLLIFGAGTRSRTGELQPFLTGVHRYFSVVEGVRVVPTAILGTGQMMPVGDERIHPTDLTVRFAPPIVVSEVGSTKTVLSTAHAAVDALLRGSNGVPGSAAVAGG
jgi:1-acyl-sn-glycerol-3-phosphate acyltransferase